VTEVVARRPGRKAGASDCCTQHLIAAVVVVPQDAVSYEDIVHVLEQVKMANFKKIALSSATRSMQIATGAPTAPGGR